MKKTTPSEAEQGARPTRRAQLAPAECGENNDDDKRDVQRCDDKARAPPPFPMSTVIAIRSRCERNDITIVVVIIKSRSSSKRLTTSIAC